jgi:DNA-binding Lrp family transcriptional regulator
MAKPGPKMKVQDDELVKAIKATNGPYATPVEVAERVGLSPEHTRKRLRRLEDSVLSSKDSGGVVGYWVR